MATISPAAHRYIQSSSIFLSSPMSTRQASIQRQLEKLINSASDASLTMLDSCCIAKDVLTQVKESIQYIQCILRRVPSDERRVDKRITALKSMRRKLRKETFKCLRPLKRMKNKSLTADIPVDCNLSMTLDTLREARVTIIAILESLLSLIPPTGIDGKTTMRSFATKATLLGSRILEEMSDSAGSQCAKKGLDATEIAVEDLEVQLDCIFRRLIQNRMSLLNVLTY